MLLLHICFLFLYYSPLVVCLGDNEVNFTDDPVPVFWDWRDKNMVSPVKNQGNCSACWAFSAVACIESHLKIHLDQKETLSEQFLIDCDSSHVGCGSTSVLKAFGFIVNYLGGVLRSSDYTPYANMEQPCYWDKTKKPIPVVGYRRVRSHEYTMMEYVYRSGPLSAAINSASMKRYTGGIDEPTDELCPAHTTDHAILIVGYNVYVDEKTGKIVPYWIIKNSWGEDWGDHGFYYLVLGRNACGIATDVSFSFYFFTIVSFTVQYYRGCQVQRMVAFVKGLVTGII